MCIPLIPVLYYITMVIIEVYLHCFIELVSLKELGKPTSSAEISISNSLCLKAVKTSALRVCLNIGISSKKFYTSTKMWFISKIFLIQKTNSCHLLLSCCEFPQKSPKNFSSSAILATSSVSHHQERNLKKHNISKAVLRYTIYQKVERIMFLKISLAALNFSR